MTPVFAAIRVDSSSAIGTGHVMRCLTLATKLRSSGVTVHFICRDHPGNIIPIIRSQDFSVISLPYDRDIPVRPHEYSTWLGANWLADAHQTLHALANHYYHWIIVDHYSIDYQWEHEIRRKCKRIMVIDDLANRKHDCDILVDQNFVKGYLDRYSKLVSPECKLFLGPRYALLRDEFIKAKRKVSKVRNGNIERVMVFFGGSDSTNETMKFLRAVDFRSFPNIRWDIVVGNSNPNKESIEQFCNRFDNLIYHCQISNMAEMMKEADLFIGAGGATTWERCFLGVPSITICTAENQIEITKAASEYGATWYLGTAQEVTERRIQEAIEILLDQPNRRMFMSKKAQELMFGNSNEPMYQSDDIVRYMLEVVHGSRSL